MALRKELPKPLHLGFGKPEQAAYRSGLVTDRESRPSRMINGSWPYNAREHELGELIVKLVPSVEEGVGACRQAQAPRGA